MEKPVVQIAAGVGVQQGGSRGEHDVLLLPIDNLCCVKAMQLCATGLRLVLQALKTTRTCMKLCVSACSYGHDAGTTKQQQDLVDEYTDLYRLPDTLLYICRAR